MSADEQKKKAAAAAAEFVKPGMTLGLGTGSTAAHFVDAVSSLVRSGIEICGVPTSEATRRQAEAGGIDIIEPDETTIIDLAVDGTDEVDGRLNLIKGGGGALLREKIVASAARQFIVIADKSKRVASLGKFPLPIEIDRFAFALTVRRLREAFAVLGLPSDAALRHDSNGAPFLSDGGNYILDCRLDRIPDPGILDRAIREIPGVVETGLFVGMADLVILGAEDGVATLAKGAA